MHVTKKKIYSCSFSDNTLAVKVNALFFEAWTDLFLVVLLLKLKRKIIQR